MKYKNRKIVAVEGIDGAGKTTIIKEILNYFGDNVILYSRTKKGKFIDRLVSSRFMQKHYMLQVPIYLILSYKNYLAFKIRNNKKQIIIMDRCFLSNICYFFPKALHDKKLLKKVLWFEVDLYPQTVFILDVKPTVGRTRDNNKKSLEWLINTRNAYFSVRKSVISDWIDIRIIKKDLSIESKANLIINYIQGEIKNGN